MAGFDPSTAVLAPGQFDPSTAGEGVPPESRGPLSEIGAGLARGALVGLPTLAGQALQYVSEPGGGIHEFGRGLVNSAEERGRAPSLTLQPQEHNVATNALASGAEMVAPGAAVPLALGMGAAALGASPFLAGAGAVAGAGALFGAQAGQATLDKAEKAGVDQETAQTAARLNAASTFATQTALGAVGGRLLGVFGSAMGKIVGSEGSALAKSTMDALAGTSGVLGPTLKALPVTAAEAVGLNMAQAGSSAGIERAYGIDSTSPWDAAKEQVGPALGMTALLTPLGLVTRGMQARSAQARTAVLSHADTPPELRAQLAGEYAAQLAKVDPEAAGAFRLNANLAIQHKLVLPVDAQLFDPAFMAGRAPAAEPTTSPGAGAGAAKPQAAEVRVPDLSTSLGAAPPVAANGVDFVRAVDTSGIEAMELHTQIKSDLVAAGQTPAQPMTRKEFAASEAGKALTGQARAKAYKAYLEDPETQEGLMRHDSVAHDELQIKLAQQREAEGAAADAAAAPRTAMADAMTEALKARDVQDAFAQQDALKAQQLDAIANVTKGAQLAADAEAGKVQPDANAPKVRSDILDDWKEASDAAGLGVKAQNRVPFEKAVDALGIDKMATHQEQIDAMLGLAGDKKRSQGIRDAADAVAATWLADMPAKPAEPVPLEKTEAAAAKTDTQVASEPAGTPTGRQAVLAGLAQPGATRVEVLGTLRERARGEAEALVAAPDAEKAQALQTKLDHIAAVQDKAAELDAADALKGAPPAETAAALGENIVPKPPKKGPMTLEEKRDRRAQRQADKEQAQLEGKQDAGAAAITDTFDANIATVAQRADQTADKIAELRADFAQRLRNGEKLTALEQERYDDLNGAARAIDRYTEGKASPSGAGYVDFIGQFVYKASKPYTKSLRGTAGIEGALLKVGDSEHVDPMLLAPAAFTGKLADVLENLEQHGSERGVKDLAGGLMRLLPETTIAPGVHREAEVRVDAGGKAYSGHTLATFSPERNHIEINPGGESETTILHEATHAATVSKLREAEALFDRPARNEEEARLKNAYGDLLGVMYDAQKLPGWKKQYGMTNELEFVAELYSNPRFREFLKQQTLWERAINAIRRLLGFAEKDNGLIARAVEASEPFFAENRIQSDFASTPERAAGAMDGVLQRVILAGDESSRTPLERIATATLRALLPMRTVDNIAHGVRGAPELVASNFSTGVDAYQRSNTSHIVASNYLGTPLNQFVSRLTRTLGVLGDTAKAVAVQNEMMVIGGEASRIGFDFRKNFNDNLLADSTLDVADKKAIDDLHRRFTQLQRTHPEAAKALEEGERLNRGILISKTATVLANLMDARAGVARRLAADIARLPPGDAQRALLENQFKIVNQEGLLADKHSAGLDFQDPSLKNAKNPDAVRFPDGRMAVLGLRINAAFKDAAALPEGTALRSQLQAMSGFYYALERNPYFSLGRDGDYFVKVHFKDIDSAANARIQAALAGTNKVVGDLTRGDDHAYFRFASADEAKSLRDKLVLAGEGKVFDSAWGLQAARVNDVAGAHPALRSLLSGIDDMVANHPGLDAEQGSIMKASITRQILSMLPETAARSATIGRRGIPGYSADFLTSFSRRAEGAVHDTAGLYTTRQYAEAAKIRTDAIAQLNASGSTEGRLRAQQIDDELNKRYAANMRAVGNPLVAQATSLSHSFYLGLSPAFFIRTSAQPFHRGLPIVGSKFGFATGGAEIFKAMPTAVKVVWQSMRAAADRDGMRGVLGAPIDLKGLDLKPSEQAFVQELHDRGLLDLGESSQLQRAAKGGSQRLQDTLKLVSATAQMAEMTNRLTMGLAAFRLAERHPGKLVKETSTEYAIKAINLAMDNFDPANTARAIGRHGFAGPLTPLFTQFQNYNLQTMQQIFRTAHDGFFGQDKSPEGLQRAAEAKKEFAGLMATTAMISGALGLPFANAFAGVYNNLMSDKDDPKDARIAIRNWATTTLGSAAGDVLMRGPATLANVDTSTFGLQGLLPGSDFLASRLLWKDRAEEQARSMLGPAVSLGLDLVSAGQKFSDGYYVKAIEAALPVGLRTYFKTAEMAGLIGPGGYTDSKGNPLPAPFDKPREVDLAWRALGFQTAEKAQQGEAARDFYTNQELLKHRRGVITDQFVKGVSEPGEMTSATQALIRYDRLNPMQPITADEIGGAIRSHMVGLALGGVSGTGVAVSKRQFPVLTNTERFAAMPGR